MMISLSDISIDQLVEKRSSPTQANKYASSAGIFPYTRGPYASMYTGKPWTIRQYAGFSTAEASNKFYKNCLKKGQTGLSVAFDLPTHRGYDSDNPRAKADVGMAGVAIDSLEDMKALFNGIPLNKISVSMTMNGAVIPILAFFVAMADELNIPRSELRGTIQNDILKEFIVRNTFIYPPKESLYLISDIFKFLSKECPNFNSISISGYHMHEAGADTANELAFTLANGKEYLDTGIKAGLNIDDFAPRLSFFWGIGMNFIDEIAKLRAARLLWANIVKSYFPKNPNSLRLRTHCQTSGWSLTKQSPYNNITRTAIEALSAVFGQTQSLHTNSYDEAIALPTEHSSQIARNTQLKLRDNYGLCEVIDIFGGSNIIEEKTLLLAKKASELINKTDSLGGMTEAISQGFPQQIIENNAADKQGKIDAGEFKIIGVNHLTSPNDNIVTARTIDNNKVLLNQTKNLKLIKESRDNKKVNELLQKLTEDAKSQNGKVLSTAIELAKAKATLGEISFAIEKAYTRYNKTQTSVSGIYLSHMRDKESTKNVISECKVFEEKFGRRPRILIAKLGQDGHDRGMKIIASAFSDMGFVVDMGPLFSTPEEIVKQAIENDVHIIGISTLAAAHNQLIPELIHLLQKIDIKKRTLIVGGIIPDEDKKFLLSKGVDYIFDPGAIISESALKILPLIDSN